MQILQEDRCDLCSKVVPDKALAYWNEGKNELYHPECRHRHICAKLSVVETMLGSQRFCSHFKVLIRRAA